jgi:hypothetical protein
MRRIRRSYWKKIRRARSGNGLFGRSMPRSGAAMKILRLRSGADAILTALLGRIPRGSDHGDRGNRGQARRFPLEGGAVSVCSTKTRTAALSVLTRRYPGRAGCKRTVRSISAIYSHAPTHYSLSLLADKSSFGCRGTDLLCPLADTGTDYYLECRRTCPNLQ